MDLETALAFYQVCERFNDENNAWWPEALPYGVSDEHNGVIAVFLTEQAACFYRLALVNQACNPNWSQSDRDPGGR